MVKKAKRRKIEKTCEKLEAHIQRQRQEFLCNLQRSSEESCGTGCDSNDSDCYVLSRKRNIRELFLRRDPEFSRTNVCNEDTARDNYTFPHKHFLEPHNLSQPELSFVHAVILLRSIDASRIPVKQLQRICNERLNTRSELKFSVDKDLSCISEKSSNKKSEFSKNYKIIHDGEHLVLTSQDESLSVNKTFGEEFEGSPKSFIITPKNKSQISSESFEHLLDNSPLQDERANTIDAANFERKISDDSAYNTIDIFNCDTVIKAGSINKVFEEEQHLVLMGQDNSLSVDKTFGEEFEGSPKSFIITPKNISQISSESFEHLLDNSPLRDERASTIDAAIFERDISDDSAYNTIDIFKCDTVIKAGSINKVFEKEQHLVLTGQDNSLSVDETFGEEFEGSPKSFIITPKDISQISESEFLLDNSLLRNGRTSTTDAEIFKRGILKENSSSNIDIFKCDTVIKSGSIMSDIEHCYESSKRKTCKKKVSSLIHQTPSDDRLISFIINSDNEKTDTCQKAQTSTIRGPREKRESARADLSKEENENEITPSWLNLNQAELLHLILKKIVSTLFDETMIKSYVIRQKQKNMRRNIHNYWKDSLEEEAINRVLNVSNSFLEKKPNICVKVIVQEIAKTLNKMTEQKGLFKLYRTQVYVMSYIVHI
ncbi:PREDICTED: uncharacterized protein LOC105461970 [Wasmannia auropunctata]|uniref:uncharacterized protein LOC105461970 n=1 Tax=Wasmannia auropunctata TaxID=64793 RepID=UPI0005EFD80D|nr:PREDICTED: uncharacterized protein LOC105461970 [Wasmannia auropunctata]